MRGILMSIFTDFIALESSLQMLQKEFTVWEVLGEREFDWESKNKIFK